MNWKDNFKESKELILATSSKDGKPNANIVISLGFVDNNLLIANCQMKTTIENLRENQNVCIIGGYIRLKGTAKTYSSGKYFDLCVRKNRKYEVNNAILISVKEVFDLDKVKRIL